MTTGAFSQNVGKLFSELKLVTDNLLSIYVPVVSLLSQTVSLALLLEGERWAGLIE